MTHTIFRRGSGGYTTNEHNCDLNGYILNLTDENKIKEIRLWKLQSEPYKLYNLLSGQSINSSST